MEPDSYISVVVAEYGDYPETVQNLVAKTTDGGYSLTPHNRLNSEHKIKIQPKSKRGTIPEHARITQSQKIKWKIYVEEPGKKFVDISYSFQGKLPGGKLKIVSADTVLNHNVEPTGKTVGEPYSDWVIDNFKSYNLGKIHFPKEGFYEIDLEIQPDRKKEFLFQWIWLK